MNEQKKGLSPLAWIGIGCAGLVVVGVIVVFGAGLFISKKVADLSEKPVETGAKLYALANPDLEYVSSDEESRTVVFRNEKTGEKITMDFDDIEDGTFSIETAEGKQTVSVQGGKKDGGMTITTGEGRATIGGGGGRERIPDWVPVFPGAGVNVGFTSTSGDSATGMIELTEWDDGEEVIEYYAETLEEDGYKITRNTVSFGDTEQVMVSGTSEDRRRTISAQWINSNGESKIMLQYNQK